MKTGIYSFAKPWHGKGYMNWSSVNLEVANGELYVVAIHHNGEKHILTVGETVAKDMKEVKKGGKKK